ncbi:MAG TPA: insulinase family protein [Roseateles sp.]
MNETNHASNFRRCAAGLLAALTLALQVPQAQADAGPRWGHEVVQREHDPAVRFGRLPNGLRYALRHNETPKDGVAMRLYVGSGSLQERDEERGLAHFLEHMAFRGSANLPDGEVVRMLERQGLRFGADTNARTGFDQTVYLFDFPKADAQALDTGLMLFREIGSRLTLDPQLIEQEKGVILSEERVRDKPTLRASIAKLQLMLAGTRVTQRLPIGQIETIQAATAERLRRYYQAYYRPDNAALIIVGNIDVDAVERQIRDRFADWQPAGQPDAPDLSKPSRMQPTGEFIAAGAPDALSLTWLRPVEDVALSTAALRDRLVQQMAVRVLNQRLGERGLKAGSGYRSARADVERSVYGVTGAASIEVAVPPERWAAALDAAVEELRQLLDQGVQAADQQRALTFMRSMLQSNVARAATRPHAEIAEQLLVIAHGGALHRSAEQTLAENEPLLAGIRPEELTAALRRLFGGQPLLFRSAKASAVGTQALQQQLAQALSRPLADRAAPAAVDWPYTDFGTASAIVGRTTDAELGSTTVLFANGARLVVKTTTHEKDKVYVHALLGQGRSGMTPQQLRAVWALPLMAVGGTGQRSAAELTQWRQSSGKQVGVGLAADKWHFLLAGITRPADLLTQLQVLAAHARDPGFRPEMAEKLADLASAQAGRVDTEAALVFLRARSHVMNSGDARLGVAPGAADYEATRADDLPAILRGPLAGAADVVIVGDVGVEAAIAAVQSTFGAGAARARLPRVDLLQAPLSDGGAPHVAYHRGRVDQALLGWQWAMPDHWADPALSHTGQLAAALLRARLMDSVRERLGITYSPIVTGGGSLDTPGQGAFALAIETPPEKFDDLREVLRAQLRELGAQPVSADELQRARQPMLEGLAKARESNTYWAYWLPQILAQPRMKAALLGQADGLQAVTAQQLQAFFLGLAGRQPIEVVARAAEVPEGK